MFTYVLKGSPLRVLGSFILLLSLVLGVKAQSSDLAISRSIEKTGERQYLVTVNVKKGDLTGYAKLEEMVPESFVASKEETRSANYIFKEGEAKFIWMELPSDAEFEVAYKLIQKQSKAGKYTITGRLSCVSGEDLLRVRDTSSFEVKAPKDLAQNNGGSGKEADAKSKKDKEAVGDKSKDEKEEKKSSEEANGKDPQENGADSGSNDLASKEEGDDNAGKENTGKDEGSSESEETASEPKEEQESSSDMAASDAYFSVQIATFKEKKNDRYFEEQYGIPNADIHHYKESGLLKYNLGRFASYKEANNKKKELRSKGLNGAFVVGFKGGAPVEASSLRKTKTSGSEGEASKDLARKSEDSGKEDDGEREKDNGTAGKKGPEGDGGGQKDNEKVADNNTYFSVQIGAFSEKKSDRYFEEQYGIRNADIHHYKKGDLLKYSLGRFVSYQEANKKKKELRSKGVQGAFVVGFKGGDPVKVSSLRE